MDLKLYDQNVIVLNCR